MPGDRGDFQTLDTIRENRLNEMVECHNGYMYMLHPMRPLTEIKKGDFLLPSVRAKQPLSSVPADIIVH